MNTTSPLTTTDKPADYKDRIEDALFDFYSQADVVHGQIDALECLLEDEPMPVR